MKKENSEQWVDLPNGKNGNVPSQEDYAITNPMALIGGGPHDQETAPKCSTSLRKGSNDEERKITD